MTDGLVREQAAAVIAFEQVPLSEVHHYGVAKPKNGAGDVFEVEDVHREALAPRKRRVIWPLRRAMSLRRRISGHQAHKGGEIQLTDADPVDSAGWAGRLMAYA